MIDAESGDTFRGLPLTPEQDSEIRHYIHVRSRSGMPWDTAELQGMIADMLDPPELGEETDTSLEDGVGANEDYDGPPHVYPNN